MIKIRKNRNRYRVSRLASRFWDITRGQIKVGGMDISKIDPKTLMSIYSIVFQDVTLFNNSIMENIRIGKQNATDEEVIAAAKLAHCDEFAELLFTRHYPARCFGMRMPKSRDIPREFMRIA